MRLGARRRPRREARLVPRRAPARARAGPPGLADRPGVEEVHIALAAGQGPREGATVLLAVGLRFRVGARPAAEQEVAVVEVVSCAVVATALSVGGEVVDPA